MLVKQIPEKDIKKYEIERAIVMHNVLCARTEMGMSLRGNAEITKHYESQLNSQKEKNPKRVEY